MRRKKPEKRKTWNKKCRKRNRVWRNQANEKMNMRRMNTRKKNTLGDSKHKGKQKLIRTQAKHDGWVFDGKSPDNHFLFSFCLCVLSIHVSFFLCSCVLFVSLPAGIRAGLVTVFVLLSPTLILRTAVMNLLIGVTYAFHPPFKHFSSYRSYLSLSFTIHPFNHPFIHSSLIYLHPFICLLPSYPSYWCILSTIHSSFVHPFHNHAFSCSLNPCHL